MGAAHIFVALKGAKITQQPIIIGSSSQWHTINGCVVTTSAALRGTIGCTYCYRAHYCTPHYSHSLLLPVAYDKMLFMIYFNVEVFHKDVDPYL
jgi:hypothetical protein